MEIRKIGTRSGCDYDWEGEYEANLYDWKEEGRVEGRIEGAAENSREVARKMKVEGIPAEVITKCTGLTAEEVEAL